MQQAMGFSDEVTSLMIYGVGGALGRVEASTASTPDFRLKQGVALRASPVYATLS